MNLAVPVTTSTLRVLAMPASPSVSFLTAPSLKARTPSRSTSGSPKVMPGAGGLLGVGEHAREVQQRLGGDAADVEADAAEALVALDEHGLQAEVGGAEGGGVAAGARADDDDIDAIAVARVSADGRFVSFAGSSAFASSFGGSSSFAGCPSDSSVRIGVPWETLSPTLTSSSPTVPASGEGTSMLALSDSSTINGSSAATVSPGETSTSITGTSVKSPMSGTLTSLTAGPAACRPARRRGAS